MNDIQPYSWSAFPLECLWYFVPMGVLHFAIFGIGCLVIAVAALWQRGTFLRRTLRLGLFLGLLLAAGSIANGLWSCLVWGRLYFSTDYVFDFSPFWPMTQGIVEASFGNMRGRLLEGAHFQLQLVWLLFAAGTWTAAVLGYRRTSRVIDGCKPT